MRDLDWLTVVLVGALGWLWFQEGGGMTVGTITEDPATWPAGDRLWDVCRAVARAEGYDQAGSAPYRLNTPGDLSPGDEGGYAVAGPAEFHGGSYVIHFASAADGWNALRHKFNNIASGHSSVYGSDWSIEQIAATYAGDAVSWGRNVAAFLNVDVTATLDEILRGL